MSTEPEDLDRVVSRRVDHPTDATDSDAEAYSPPDAEPDPDTDSGGAGGSAERAARDQAAENEDEPTRSE